MLSRSKEIGLLLDKTKRGNIDVSPKYNNARIELIRIVDCSEIRSPNKNFKTTFLRAFLMKSFLKSR
jgi:hypothetical protein